MTPAKRSDWKASEVQVAPNAHPNGHHVRRVKRELHIPSATASRLHVWLHESFEGHCLKHVALRPHWGGRRPPNDGEVWQRVMPDANRTWRCGGQGNNRRKSPAMACPAGHNHSWPSLHHFCAHRTRVEGADQNFPGFRMVRQRHSTNSRKSPQQVGAMTGARSSLLRESGRLQRCFAPQTPPAKAGTVTLSGPSLAKQGNLHVQAPARAVSQGTHWRGAADRTA